MAVIEDYVKRADECLRQAGACSAESNRAIFMEVAAKWRMLAKEEAKAGAVPAPPSEAMQDSGGFDDAGSVKGHRDLGGGE